MNVRNKATLSIFSVENVQQSLLAALLKGALFNRGKPKPLAVVDAWLRAHVTATAAIALSGAKSIDELSRDAT